MPRGVEKVLTKAPNWLLISPEEYRWHRGGIWSGRTYKEAQELCFDIGSPHLIIEKPLNPP
jgi:hypothetical protein